MPEKNLTVTCGLCKVIFSNNAQYLDHVCSVTGFTPRDPEHFGKRFILQSKAALKRTGSLTKEEENKLDQQIKTVKDNDIDEKINQSQIK